MAQIDHDSRARRHGGQRHVRTADGALLPYVRSVRPRVQTRWPMSRARQIGRFASPDRMELLVSVGRVRC